jgi:uncharacterized small protein (DUF1192 family)
MMEDDEKGGGDLSKRSVSHEIGQMLDSLSVAEIGESLSVAEIGERIDLLNAEIVRLEQARRLKQDAQAAAAAFFKI